MDEYPRTSSGGSGSVTSVGLSLPNLFTITNSPVTSSGTLTATFVTKASGLVFAGPSSGAAATPTFRALVSGDLPSLSSLYLPLAGGTMSGALNMGAQNITAVGSTSWTDPAQGTMYLGSGVSTGGVTNPAIIFRNNNDGTRTGMTAANNAGINFGTFNSSGIASTVVMVVDGANTRLYMNNNPIVGCGPFEATTGTFSGVVQSTGGASSPPTTGATLGLSAFGSYGGVTLYSGGTRIDFSNQGGDLAIAQAGNALAYMTANGIYSNQAGYFVSRLNGTDKTFYGPELVLDKNSNELIKWVTTSSAINEFTVTNAATGSGPTLSATGGDSNIPLNLAGKGTSPVVSNSGFTVSGAIPSTVYPSAQLGTYTDPDANISSKLSLSTTGGSHVTELRQRSASCSIYVDNNERLRIGPSDNVLLASGGINGFYGGKSYFYGNAIYSISQIEDSNNNELLKFTTTASAINELTLANAAAGGSPVISATGGDTDISIGFTPKGAGGVKNNSAVTTINGDVTGTLKWSQPEQGSGYKKFVLVATSFNNTGATTITFPTAFSNTPTYIIGTGGTIAVTSVSTTQIVIPISAGTSGVVLVEGI